MYQQQKKRVLTSHQRKLQSKTFEYDILPIQNTRSLFPQFRGLSNCPVVLSGDKKYNIKRPNNTKVEIDK